MEKEDHPAAFGVFKPVDHVVASFPTDADAQGARAALVDAGFAASEIVYYTPEQMVAQADRDMASASPLASIGQELNLVKAHRELASRGSSFLVVHAPKDEQIAAVTDVVKRFNASRAQSYGTWMIEELIEVGSDERQVAESPDRGLDAQTHSGREQH